MSAFTARVTPKRPGVSFYVDQALNTKAFAAHRSTFGTQGAITQSTNTRTIPLPIKE